MRLTCRWLGPAATLALALWSVPGQAGSTDTAMYFHSYVRDAPSCAMTAAKDGTIGFPDAISAPAATCPDAFGWKQFLEAIQAEFWEQWANDETVWVRDPKALCTSADQTDCCFVAPGETPQVGYRGADGQPVQPADIGSPGLHCPYIPGDWGGSDETTFESAKPITTHNATFLRTLDEARIARQREVEVVYRNDPFVRYTTAHELYSIPGLQKLFKRISGQAANSAPYRPEGQGVTYPSDAVMFKADWIPEETMLELGYIRDHDNDPATVPQDPDHPYITMKIKASTAPDKPKTDGIYYLAAITGASKALPNWHWYAFEHVNNLGRCDYTGCNDSYGFSTEVTMASPMDKDQTITVQSNFIRPHVEKDELEDGTDLFDTGKRYPSGQMNDGLAALFRATGIGAGGEPVDADMPNVSDPAWQSYRLKGTQTQFYTNDGYPTIVGASITEGGFVNTASCLSCHVQASVNAEGGAGTSVGSTGRLNLFGIGESVNGAPYTGDYYMRGTTDQHAVRVDYVWGILFAESPKKSGE